MQQLWATPECGIGTDSDNAPSFLFLHLRCDGAARQPRSTHVHVHHAVPLVHADLVVRSATDRICPSGICNESVDMSPFLDDAHCHRFGRLLRRNIRFEKDRVSSTLAKLFSCFYSGRFINFSNSNVRPFGNEPFRIGAPESPSSAGDNDNPAFIGSHPDLASVNGLPSGYDGNSGFCAPSIVRNATSLSPSFRTPRQIPAGIQMRSRGPSFRSIRLLPSDQMHVSSPSRTKNSSSTSVCKCSGPSLPGGMIMVLSVK